MIQMNTVVRSCCYEIIRSWFSSQTNIRLAGDVNALAIDRLLNYRWPREIYVTAFQLFSTQASEWSMFLPLLTRFLHPPFSGFFIYSLSAWRRRSVSKWSSISFFFIPNVRIHVHIIIRGRLSAAEIVMQSKQQSYKIDN